MSVRDQYLRAIDVLRAGGLVALPTDTVYGLCAVAADAAAVERLYEVKQRDRTQPLPLFVASVEQARLIVEWNAAAEALAARFWPGALTIVLPRKPAYRTPADGGGATIGVRVPHDAALREMAAQLGDAVDLIVDAPVAASGQPSTIVDCADEARVTIVRQGAIARDAIAAALAGVANVG